MDRLGIIPTSSAIALHFCDGCLINTQITCPKPFSMRTSGLFIGKRPLYLRICPLFSGKCPLFFGKRPLFLRICPLFLGECPLFFWGMSFVSSGKYLMLLRTCPLFFGKRALFFGKRPLYLLKYRTLRERFLRQTRLCMVGDNNRVIKCKRHRSVTLSRARVREYCQEFNDFCCHICHMCILNCYVSVKYSNLWHVLTKRQSESCFFFLGDSPTWAFSCSFNRFAALFYRFFCAVLPLSLLDFTVFAASIFLHRIRCVTDVTAKKHNLLVYTRARSIGARMSRRVRKKIPGVSVMSYWRV